MTILTESLYKTDRFFYFHTLCQRLCLVLLSVHSALSVIYNTLNIPELSIANAICVAAYYSALKLNLHKQLGWAWLLINIAVIGYTFASSYIIGITGARNMLMFLPMLFFLYPVSFNKRLAYVLFCAAIYIGMAYYQLDHTAQHTLSHNMLQVLNIAMGALTLFTLTYFIYYAYRAIRWQEEQMMTANSLLRDGYLELEKQATQDKLTTLYNRHKIENVIALELERTYRHKTTFAVILVDIDHFKPVNDTHGHNTGDTILQEFAQILINNARNLDSIGRCGGEEFIIILPETNKIGASTLAEKLRKSIQTQTFHKNLHLTASFGVSAHEDNESFKSLLERTDQALYASKKNGRNRITVY